jgi:threonine dehydrogenase-like Zn-dependent dehydrogenase
MIKNAKAAVWIGQSKLEIIDVQIPEVREDGMLIKVDAVGICGTDIHVYSQKPSHPSILGHEITGTIVATGKNANKNIKSFSGSFKVGQRITLYPWITCGQCVNCLKYGNGACTVCENSFTYGLPYENTGLSGKALYSSDINEFPYLKGGFSEYMYIFPGTYVWRVPDDMPKSIATLLDPLAVATRAMELGTRSPGVLEDSLNTTSTVLIIGDGPTGLLCALAARILGVKTIIVAGGRDKRLQVARKIFKSDYTLNYHLQSLEERKQIIYDLTNGCGADTVFQCAGTPQAFRDGIELMKRLGTLIEVGNIVKPAPVQFDPTKDLCAKHATYIGMSVNTPMAYNKAFNILLNYKKYELDQIFTHKCTLETLDDMLMNNVKNRDYIKGWVDIK